MIIIDIEASGLASESYPIQIALYETSSGSFENHYIKPVDEWTHWCVDAEDIHNIPRSLLSDIGISTHESVERVMAFMKEHKETIMYSDAPDFDGFWLNRLFKVEKIGNTDIQIANVLSLCNYMEEITQLMDLMRSQERSHDALDDCKQIWYAVQKTLY